MTFPSASRVTFPPKKPSLVRAVTLPDASLVTWSPSIPSLVRATTRPDESRVTLSPSQPSLVRATRRPDASNVLVSLDCLPLAVVPEPLNEAPACGGNPNLSSGSGSASMMPVLPSSSWLLIPSHTDRAADSITSSESSSSAQSPIELIGASPLSLNQSYCLGFTALPSSHGDYLARARVGIDVDCRSRSVAERVNELEAILQLFGS